MLNNHLVRPLRLCVRIKGYIYLLTYGITYVFSDLKRHRLLFGCVGFVDLAA